MDEDPFCKSVKWKVKTSKYELKDRTAPKKWREFIKTVENNKPVVPSKRSSVVKRILPASVYERMCHIVGLERMTPAEREQFAVPNEIFAEDSSTSINAKRATENLTVISRPSTLPKVATPSTSSISSDTSIPDVDDINCRSKLQDLVDQSDPVSFKLGTTPLRSLVGTIGHPAYSDMKVHSPSRIRCGRKKEQYILLERGGVPRKKQSPYHNFLCKPKSKAAEAWSPPIIPVIPPNTPVSEYHKYFEGYNLSLLQKESITTKAIVRDFCNWVKTLGGAEMPELQENVVFELFNPEFDKPAARAISVMVREMPVVPDTVADAVNAPDKSIRSGLMAEVLRDVKAEESPPKIVGFGRTLPKEERFVPPRNNTRKRWLDVNTVPEIESMKVVWKGILPLRTTKEFCKYLLEHPELPKPPYLKKMGMLPGPGEEPFVTGQQREAPRPPRRCRKYL